MNEGYPQTPPPASYQPPPQQPPQPQFVYPQVNLNVRNGMPYENLSPTVTKMDWFIFIILSSIPFVNFIALIFYAIDSTKPSRANFARTSLILMVVTFVLAIVAIIAFGGLAAIIAASQNS